VPTRKTALTTAATVIPAIALVAKRAGDGDGHGGSTDSDGDADGSADSDGDSGGSTESDRDSDGGDGGSADAVAESDRDSENKVCVNHGAVSVGQDWVGVGVTQVRVAVGSSARRPRNSPISMTIETHKKLFELRSLSG
jgi:chromosome segregation protein